jgi:hypothetical protein
VHRSRAVRLDSEFGGLEEAVEVAVKRLRAGIAARLDIGLFEGEISVRRERGKKKRSTSIALSETG